MWVWHITCLVDEDIDFLRNRGPLLLHPKKDELDPEPASNSILHKTYQGRKQSLGSAFNRENCATEYQDANCTLLQ